MSDVSNPVGPDPAAPEPSGADLPGAGPSGGESDQPGAAAFDVGHAQDAVAATYQSSPLTLVPIVAGPLLVVLSFIPLWYRAHAAGQSELGNAWHGPLPVIALFLSLIASMLLLVRLVGLVQAELLVNLIAAAVFVLAFVFFVISIFVMPGKFGDVKDAADQAERILGNSDGAGGIGLGANSFVFTWLAAVISGAAAAIAALPVLKIRKA
jgi:hypothetical protein